VHGKNESVENADDLDGLLDSLRAKVAKKIGACFELDNSHPGRALDVAKKIGARFKFQQSYAHTSRAF
jgi:hypothetical protein